MEMLGINLKINNNSESLKNRERLIKLLAPDVQPKINQTNNLLSLSL